MGGITGGAHVASVLGDLDRVFVQLLAHTLVQPVRRRYLHHLRGMSGEVTELNMSIISTCFS